MYMNKAFSDVLHGMMPNAIPLTCNAHILSLASDVWRTGFPDVDTLVSSFLKKKTFKHCPSRKLRYRESIANQSDKAPATLSLPPEPVITRWNSWFNAVSYHAKNIQYYQQFVCDELEITPDTQSLLKIRDLLKQSDIADQVKFVAENASRFVQLLTWFESRKFLSTKHTTK